MLHERFLFEQRFKVPVHFTHPVTGVIREEQNEVILDAFVEGESTGRTRSAHLPDTDRGWPGHRRADRIPPN